MLNLKKTFFLNRFKIKSFKNFSGKSVVNMDEEEMEFETNEEKELRFQDECFYWEKEWNKFEIEKIYRRQDYFSKDLSLHQVRQCEVILDKLTHLNSHEYNYFNSTAKEFINKSISVDPGCNNTFFPANYTEVKLTQLMDNPNYIPTQKILSTLSPFIASGYFSGGASQVAIAVEEVKVVDKKVIVNDISNVNKYIYFQKTRLEVKLLAFDPVKKITLIKEVRAIFTLGLKEAKELVERAPVTLKRDIYREEAHEIKAKLEENGGTIELL